MTPDRDPFNEELAVEGEARPLLPEGEYEVACIGAEYATFHRFGKARKLVLHFEIYGGDYTGSRLFMAMTAPGKGEKVKRASKLYANYLIASSQPPGWRDRLSYRVFKGGLFLATIKTVKPTFETGAPKPALFHYSVVGELLERLA